MRETSPTNDLPPRKRQFTIRSLLFATTLVAIAAAGFGALVRADEDDLPTASILFVVAAPLALMLILSLIRTIEHFVSVWRERHDRHSDG